MVTQIHALNFLLSSGAAQRVALRRKKCPNHPLYGFFLRVLPWVLCLTGQQGLEETKCPKKDPLPGYICEFKEVLLL